MNLAGIDSSGGFKYIAIVVCEANKLRDVFLALNLRPGFHMRKHGINVKRKVALTFVKAVKEVPQLKTLCIQVGINHLAKSLARKYRMPRTKALNKVLRLCRREIFKLLTKFDVREVHYDSELIPVVNGFHGRTILKGPATTLADILAWINLRRNYLDVDESEAIIFINLEKKFRKMLRLD